MRRIQRVAKVVKLLAHALLWVSLFFAGIAVWMWVTYSDRDDVFDLPLHLMLAYQIGLGVLLAIMFREIAALATSFERAELFTAANVGHLRRVGWLTLLTVVSPGLDGSAEVTPSALVVGLLLVFVSWVLDEARALKDEADLVI